MSFVRRFMLLTRAFGRRTTERSGQTRNTYTSPWSSGFVTAKPVPEGLRSICQSSNAPLATAFMPRVGVEEAVGAAARACAKAAPAATSESERTKPGTYRIFFFISFPNYPPRGERRDQTKVLFF